MKKKMEQYIKIPVDIKDFSTEKDSYWMICSNHEFKKALNADIFIVAKGGTLEEAEKDFLSALGMNLEFLSVTMLAYQRWVPFRKGNWKEKGDRWFAIFGFHFQFTGFKVRIHSEWKSYKLHKKLLEQRKKLRNLDVKITRNF